MSDTEDIVNAIFAIIIVFLLGSAFSSVLKDISWIAIAAFVLIIIAIIVNILKELNL